MKVMLSFCLFPEGIAFWKLNALTFFFWWLIKYLENNVYSINYEYKNRRVYMYTVPDIEISTNILIINI